MLTCDWSGPHQGNQAALGFCNNQIIMYKHNASDTASVKSTEEQKSTECGHVITYLT